LDGGEAPAKGEAMEAVAKRRKTKEVKSFMMVLQR